MRFATVKIKGHEGTCLVLEEAAHYYPIAEMRSLDELLQLIPKESSISTDGVQRNTDLDMELSVVPVGEQTASAILTSIAGELVDKEQEIKPEEISEFLPPVLAPTKVICVGVNYRDHIKEMGREIEAAPTLFPKFAQSLLGAQQPLVLPLESGKLDYEAELAIIIGREMRRVSPAEALGGVAGYTCANDGSVRDWQVATSQWMAGKAWDGLTPIGPVMVTVEELPEDARIQSRINGELRQNSRISELVFDAATLVSYISTFTKLVPGDIILTGTPGGVGVAMKPPQYLQAGDLVEVEIEGIGVLRNSVV